jgi:FkbM family methyltransferase
MATFRYEQDPIFSDIRQRLIHVEGKIDALLDRVPVNESFHGSPHQRYGHLTYSQHGEDLVFVSLLERFGVEHPTYLDIGANHPIDCSNTALLYRRGARGVNVDASPEVIKIFEEQRPDDTNVNVGVASKSGEMTFFRCGATSGRNSFSLEVMEQFLATHPGEVITDEIVVPVVTLDDIIETYCEGRCPHLLSIDAEGLDYEILSAASFASRPKILCVETLSAAGETEDILDKLLVSRGFRKCIQMFANAVYIDRDAKL